MSKSKHAKDVSVARKIGAEAAQCARRNVAEGMLFPPPEVGKMIEPHGQEVCRSFGNDLLPDAAGAARVAFAPRRERRDVHLLSFRSQLGVATRLLQSLARRRDGRNRANQQHKIAAEALAHDEGWVGGKRRLYA